jgi:hypothetical protein
MRVPFSCTLLVILALGVGFGQDTNFASGPQYLMTSGSPMWARPISTPTISLTGPALEAGASDATGVLIPGAANRTVLPPEAVSEPAIDLYPIFYGVRPASVIEISFAGASSEQSIISTLPASIVDTGVGQMITPQALRERGYGVTLPEAAARQKARIRPGTRVYTNADIDRLHGGN